MSVLCKGYARCPTVLESRWAGRVLRELRHGSRSERATRVAALFYSPIKSTKLAGVEPGAETEKPLTPCWIARYLK